LDRAFTARTLLALGFIAAAGALSAAAALVATHLLASRPWTARFAAALFCLTAGAVGLTSLFLAIEVAWASHPLAELPLHIVLLIRREYRACRPLQLPRPCRIPVPAPRACIYRGFCLGNRLAAALKRMGGLC